MVRPKSRFSVEKYLMRFPKSRLRLFPKTDAFGSKLSNLGQVSLQRLPQRPMRSHRHEYLMGVRLGEKASVKLARNPLMTLANTPPGIRLSSPRETLPFLASYQQVGLPAVAAPDAQLGYSVYTYQSGEVALGSCGAEGHVLWRVVGQHSRAHGQT